MTDYVGEYAIKGLVGSWIFWDHTAADGIMWFVPASYPVIPDNIYADNSLAASTIRDLNENNDDPKFVRVPSSYVKKRYPEVEELTLF